MRNEPRDFIPAEMDLGGGVTTREYEKFIEYYVTAYAYPVVEVWKPDVERNSAARIQVKGIGSRGPAFMARVADALIYAVTLARILNIEAGMKEMNG